MASREEGNSGTQAQTANSGLVCAHPPKALSGAGSLESRPRKQKLGDRSRNWAMKGESGALG